jgi:hypothetical protein
MQVVCEWCRLLSTVGWCLLSTEPAWGSDWLRKAPSAVVIIQGRLLSIRSYLDPFDQLNVIQTAMTQHKEQGRGQGDGCGGGSHLGRASLNTKAGRAASTMDRW